MNKYERKREVKTTTTSYKWKQSGKNGNRMCSPDVQREKKECNINMDTGCGSKCALAMYNNNKMIERVFRTDCEFKINQKTNKKAFLFVQKNKNEETPNGSLSFRWFRSTLIRSIAFKLNREY